MLTGLQAHFRRDRSARLSTLAVVTLVCLALLALLTVSQVIHTHPNPGEADHCLLCVTMHSAAPTAASEAVVEVADSWTPAPVLEVRAVTRYWQPQLFTRPPPSVS